jgi:hypothetical protein
MSTFRTGRARTLPGMDWVVKCECGELLAGADEEALAAAADRHLCDCHPALSVRPSRADLLAMAQPADIEHGSPT